MAGRPAVLDQHGREVSRAEVARARRSAMLSGGVTPFDAADRNAPEMAGWQPWLGSPDTEIGFYRDLSVARIRDLVRNDGWASGAVTRIMDATVGAELRLSAIPDYRALAARFGGAFDARWAKEFSDAAEAAWRAWAYDPRCYCDTTRRMTFARQTRLAFRHYLVEGEGLAVLPWRPDRIGYGKARYGTTVQLVDPDRLSNPQQRFDLRLQRGGVEIDEDGVPIAYHIRRAHQQDWWAASDAVTWDRIPRETEWGRPMVVHHFDAERADQHRPIGGIFTPVLARMRMLAQYDRLEVQAAVINAIFAAYVESPYDPDMVQEGLTDAEQIPRYQQLRSAFHQDRRLVAGNARIATLFPGEKLNTISTTRPNAAFDAFEGAMLRNVAAAVGMPFEMLSQDYRGSTYSSARQSMLEGWRTIGRRRQEFGHGFCSPVYNALLEEAIDRGDVPLPAGAPDFAEARAEYARCRWIGPGRGWVDPVKEPEGSLKKVAGMLSTLELEAAENSGLDFEEIMDQQQFEKEELERRGLTVTLVTTGGQQSGQDAKPEKEEERAR